MLGYEKDNWLYGFWSALMVEQLCRAALAKVSPVLLAEGKDWQNLYYALGNTSSTHSPRSATTAEILKRLEAIIPEFHREHSNFCTLHAERRNGELHSGDLPFDAVRTTDWLPQLLITAKILLEYLDQDLEFLLGPDEAVLAQTMIDSYLDEAAKAVQGSVEAFRRVWESKDEADRNELAKQAQLHSLKQDGHRVQCPACGSSAMLNGTPTRTATSTLDGSIIVERQEYLPSQFECIACGLKIAGHSQLNACGLGDPFTRTTEHDPIDYFGGVDTLWEPDYND